MLLETTFLGREMIVLNAFDTGMELVFTMPWLLLRMGTVIDCRG